MSLLQQKLQQTISTFSTKIFIPKINVFGIRQFSNNKEVNEENKKENEEESEEKPKEFNGPKGPEPTRYGDWERKGRVSDF
uniref:Succinate dehydrogenase assembly factor 4, mitochondrial n=2 Tax=Meloidogyne TaxID=189290 RepID=A0A6V7W689_MELEN|nr:unnamed protein product [Meloidogyne enterolobii]